MDSASVRRAVVLLGLLMATAVPVLAQGPSAAVPEEEVSLLNIFIKGIEVPTYFIVAGSIVAIALIAEHFYSIRRASIAPADQITRARQQIETRAFRECLDSLKRSRTFFAQTMTAALQHARHGFDAMHEAALEKSSQLSGRMFRKAEFLNIIGNLGPLLGLLGTVWGMIVAFGQLQAAGGAAEGATRLAGGISTALVNTLAGLALAIVGIGFFGVCRNRIESLTVGATVDALDLLEYFRPSQSRSERSAARSGASKGSSETSESRSS
jgi:biopolymer transport protein ExbB